MGFIRPSRELAPAEERRGGERTVDASPSRGSSVLPPPGRCAPAGRWLLPAQCQTIIEQTAPLHHLTCATKVIASCHFTTRTTLKHLRDIIYVNSVVICAQSGTDVHLTGGHWSRIVKAEVWFGLPNTFLSIFCLTLALHQNDYTTRSHLYSLMPPCYLNLQIITHVQNRMCLCETRCFFHTVTRPESPLVAPQSLGGEFGMRPVSNSLK